MTPIHKLHQFFPSHLHDRLRDSDPSRPSITSICETVEFRNAYTDTSCGICGHSIAKGDRMFHSKGTKRGKASTCLQCAPYFLPQWRIVPDLVRNGLPSEDPSPTPDPDPVPYQPEGQPVPPRPEGMPSPSPEEIARAMHRLREVLGLGDLAHRVEVLESRTPRKIEIESPDRPPVEIDNAHPQLETVIRRVNAGFDNVWICGPAGSGKSYLAGQLAKALGLPKVLVSCSPGLTEGAIFGRIAPDESGAWSYRESPFVRGYREGAVILLDEADSLDPGVGVRTQAALANGEIATDEGTIARHDQTIIIFATNTWGEGAEGPYVGRQALDAATRDRFAGAQIEVGYDRGVESEVSRSLCGSERAAEIAWRLRESVDRLDLARIVSIRAVQGIARLLSVGVSESEALAAITVSWSEDDRTRAIEGVL